MNLDEAISPTRAVEKLLTRGVKVSERTLRVRARELGAYRGGEGKGMFFLPEDLERIFEPLVKSQSEPVTQVFAYLNI